MRSDRYAAMLIRNVYIKYDIIITFYILNSHDPLTSKCFHISVWLEKLN